MNKRKLLTTILLIWTVAILAQDPVEITDQTIKIGGMKEEEIYIGFAEGDKLIFNFREIDNKELKEIEILEYPGTPIFSDYQTKSIDNKTIPITRQGVYIFRFKNTAISGRICKIKIQRIPVSDATKNFNTTVSWETKQETTYNNYTKDVIVGYDTTYVQKTKKELIKTELSEEIILDKSERVNSESNLEYTNYKTIQVTLPPNQVEPYKTKKISSWAYWIGVGKESTDAWTKNVTLMNSIADGALEFIGGTPLLGISLGILTNLIVPTSGDDVAYYFIPDYQNEQLFMAQEIFYQFDKGKGIAAYSKNNTKTQGTFYIGLVNDNLIEAIDVDIKISIVWETNTYEDQHYNEMNISPRYEKKQFSEPIITTHKIPRTGP